MDDETISLELRVSRAMLRQIDGHAWRERRSRQEVLRDLIAIGLEIDELRRRFGPETEARRRSS